MQMERPAHQTSFVALDFETTGHVRDLPNEPWQIGMIRVVGGVVHPEESWESLFRIGPRPFNPHAPGRYMELREELAQAPRPAELLPELIRRLGGTPLVAHNAATERGQLERMAPMHRLGPWVDTLRLARRVYPDLPSHALDDVLVTLGLVARVQACCPGRVAHDALYDAVGCGVFLEHCLALPGWEQVTLGDLVECH